MDFKELLETAQAEAISNKLIPTVASEWRKVCREYSKRFHTPLHKVMELDPEMVVLAFYEDQFSGIDLEENLEAMLDMIYSLEDPNYDAAKEKAFREEIKRMEEEDEIRVERGEAIHPSLAKEGIVPKKVEQKNTSVKEEKVNENLPTQGGIDLSYLEEEEAGNGFFED